MKYSIRFTYFSFKDYLIQQYGLPLYRIPINLALSCPHKNKKIDGCIFCAEDGARARHLSRNIDLETQVKTGVEYTEKRYKANGNYIAYFQAYTSTNADIVTIKNLYERVLNLADFKMIIVSTRPDCISEEIINYFKELNNKYELWVELGVQTANDNTLKIINRGHTFIDTKKAVYALDKQGIKTAAHIILGLPDEKHKDYCNTIYELNKLPFTGIKIHNLLLLKNSILADLYHKHNISKNTGDIYIPQVGTIKLMNEYEYAGTLIDIIRRIPKNRPLLRINADASIKDIIGPKWTITKGRFIELVTNTMLENNFCQGDLYPNNNVSAISEENPISYLKVRTLDNSFTFYNPVYKENYHSLAGAESESIEKFIKPSGLEEKLTSLSSSNTPLKLLDIGFGLGYNAMAAIKTSIKKHSRLSINSLEIDTKVLSIAKTIYPKTSIEYSIINSLIENMKWSDGCNKIQLFTGDARKTVKNLSLNEFDIIFLDAFSPLKNPELWTYDFLKQLLRLISEKGVLVTYSAAFPVRGALLKCGFLVGETKPFGRKNGGTIASGNIENIKNPLTEKDLNIIIKSTAGIPYFDHSLNFSVKQIFSYREKLARKMRKKGIPKWYH